MPPLEAIIIESTNFEWQSTPKFLPLIKETIKWNYKQMQRELKQTLAEVFPKNHSVVENVYSRVVSTTYSTSGASVCQNNRGEPVFVCRKY